MYNKTYIWHVESFVRDNEKPRIFGVHHYLGQTHLDMVNFDHI